MNRSLVVVGSFNTKIVIKSYHLPVSGNYIRCGFFTHPAGKGANQTVEVQ